MRKDDKFADRLFKSLNDGLEFDDWLREPSLESYVQELEDLAFTKYPLLFLGMSGDEPFYLAEEERTHTHILGLPGQGKSKLLELFCRHDIDRLLNEESAPGFCLIDSSDFGGTFAKVLRYCREVGFEKVCVIDPTDLDGPIGKVATINLFGKKFFDEERQRWRYDRPKSEVASAVQDIFRVLWESEDFSRTANINRSLDLVTNALWEAVATLPDSRYFRAAKDPVYAAKREAIVSHSHPSDGSRVELDELFYRTQQSTFDQRFGSTIGRLTPVFGGPLPLMLASNTDTTNFTKLIAEGWIILVNADPHGWHVSQSRLLGTIVISEVVNAIYTLVKNGYSIPFRLYVDEVGRYASESLVEVINYKRTSQIHLVGAHQQFAQITNKKVANALASAPIKFAFYLEPGDREQMMKGMYFGGMDKQATDEFHDLAKQNVVIRVGKKNSKKVRLLDLPDIEPDSEQDAAFKAKLYQHPWYKTRDEINNEMNARFTNKEHAGAGGGFDPKGDNRKSTGKRTVRDGSTAGPADGSKPRRKTYFD